MSFDEWEDGFRRDTHPIREIRMWLFAAVVYRRFARNLGKFGSDLAKRQDIFRVVLNCMNNGPKAASATTKAPTLSRKRVDEIMHAFFHPEDWFAEAARSSPQQAQTINMGIALLEDEKKEREETKKNDIPPAENNGK